VAGSPAARSASWRNSLRNAVLSRSVNYTTVLIAIDEQTLGGLHRAMPSPNNAAADLDTLVALNDDYIRSVRASDVKRFDEILAEDFLCSLPDGTLLNRKQFLEHTAKPATISDLAVHDLNVRLMGDFAIVHARTTFKLTGDQQGKGRYTDVWARRNGAWLAVAAHVTRNQPK
jgi:ketosteroid isomerase-like protein